MPSEFVGGNAEGAVGTDDDLEIFLVRCSWCAHGCRVVRSHDTGGVGLVCEVCFGARAVCWPWWGFLVGVAGLRCATTIWLRSWTLGMTDSITTHPLAGVLTELGWAPEVLARRLNGFAALHGRGEQMHAKTPYKWLHGVVPRSPWSALAVALLTEELGRPVTAAELGWRGVEVQAVSALSGLVLPWTVAGSLRALRVVTDPGGMDRRIVLTLLGGAACTPAHEWLLARVEAAAALARPSGSPLLIGAVDDLDGIVGGLRRMDDRLGSGTLLELVRAHLRYVLGLLEKRSYTESVGRRLHATAGELMRLAGWLSFDSGAHPQAQRYWVAGLHAAHAAGDRALGAMPLS